MEAWSEKSDEHINCLWIFLIITIIIFITLMSTWNSPFVVCIDDDRLGMFTIGFYKKKKVYKNVFTLLLTDQDIKCYYDESRSLNIEVK